MLKNQLIIELATALKIINVRDEELRIAAAANNTTNKALNDADNEVKRLKKVLDRAIVTVESRQATLACIPPPPKSISNNAIGNSSITKLPEPSAEQKFLMFMVVDILMDQYPGEKKKGMSFNDGFDSMIDSMVYGYHR